MVVLAKDLRNSILLYTLQGKLVEQNFEDEPASKLLEKIENQKNELLNTGKLKKEKDLSQIKENEKLFSIPSNWERVKLGKIAKLSIGKTPDRKNSKYRTNGMTNWFSISDMNDCKVITETKEKITDIAISDCFKNGLVPAGTLIMSFKLTIGKTSILGVDAVFNEAIVAIEPYENKDNIIRNYLLKVLPMLAKEGNIKNALKGATLNKESLNNLVLPLPPLEEQKRIVKKLDEIIPKIEEYEELERESTILENKLPGDVRKAILKYAVQGKMNTQNFNDEPVSVLLRKIKDKKDSLIKENRIKKEKTLKPIKKEEKSFNIPENWERVRFSDIIDVRDGTHDSPKYFEKGVPLITSKNLYSGTLNFNNVKYISQQDADSINMRSGVDDGDILFAMIGSIGNPVIVNKDRDFCIKNVALFKNFSKENLDIKYIYWFLMYEQYNMRKNASGGLQPFISLKVFREYPVPLPPLEEQKRIVSKVDELMKLCDGLETTVNLTK